MEKAIYMWELVKIFDEWNKIEELCCEVTHSKAQLVDLHGKFIIGHKNLSTFCQYVYTSALGSIRCHECYQKNCFGKDAITQGYNVFKCHFGLTNFCVPVFQDNEVIGAIVGGGVVTRECDFRNSRLHMQEMKLDVDIFSERLKQIKCTPYQNIDSAARILKNFSKEFSDMLTPYYRQLDVLHKLSSESVNKNDLIQQDELTGLLGQKMFQYRLNEETERSERYNTPFCVLMVEIDDLRNKNEKYGHAYGDLIIKNVVDTLKRSLRKVDTLYRYRGNVFAILAANSQSHQSAKLAERLMKNVEKSQKVFTLQEGDTPIAINIGIAPYALHSSTMPLLAEHSLQALEQASNAAHGSIKIYELQTVKQKQRRVVVTGVGVVSPVGIGKPDFLSGIIQGRSGISRITSFDTTNLACKIAGEIKNFDPSQYMSRKVVERTGRSSQFAISASKMAVMDAGLGDLKDYDEKRISVIIGSAIAGLEYGEEQVESFIRQGVRKVSPYLSVIVFAGMVSSEISLELGIKGRSTTISTGCTAGADAIGYAYHEIQRGESDIVLTGGAEAPLRPVILASFCTMKAVSTHFNDVPEKASRPFDKNRDGFIMSEGAGVLILEELQHALRRGARIYGEILGYGATDDAFHLTQPAPNGESAAQAIKNAMKAANIAPEEVDYINSHGSATPLNDSTETGVVKNVFGKFANKIPVSSTKSMQGHPLGASGAIELITCILGMENKFLPPTINYEYPDPLCDLEDYVTTGARTKELNTVISNNFGFGGKNASLVLRRYC
ncbi:beta-ketoacyl-ACP synthase II [Candidatus Poribacteria bacterium]|nr:beta-ketoacyl-ACP synthase II [Candidatus Poribacteria bacterium]